VQDPFNPHLDLTGGETLTAAEYQHDFAQRSARITNRDSWKLERRQDFQELNSPSWDAADRGDWEESMRLIEARRERLMKIEREENARGHHFHRVRIVKKPLTPYMQWEMNSLRQRDECGEHICVLTVEKVRHLERTRRLPELVVLGGQALYEVLYTADGIHEGAVRHTDARVVAHYEGFIRDLYTDGEDIQSYFEREVAHLPPPKVNTSMPVQPSDNETR
jgi:hypothetical protein